MFEVHFLFNHLKCITATRSIHNFLKFVAHPVYFTYNNFYDHFVSRDIKNSVLTKEPTIALKSGNKSIKLSNVAQSSRYASDVNNVFIVFDTVIISDILAL